MLSACIIHPDNIENDLYNLLSIDSDHIGDNGNEYILDEAKNAGFENNLDYWIDRELNSERTKDGNFFVKVTNTIEAIINIYNGERYYCNFEWEMLEYKDVYFCAISYDEEY